ncbi:DUF427 domain-containing protein [soil metagenome]
MSDTKARESVWDYPRPPRVELVGEEVRIELGGETIARTNGAVRVLETASPPQIYLPPGDIVEGALEPVSGHSVCEWKGVASYADALCGGKHAERAAWLYPSPNPRYEELRGYVSFYPGRVDGAYIGEEKVRPQAGKFYGGWVTDNIEGPMKGEPGTEGW